MKLTRALCLKDGVSTAASKPSTFTSDPANVSSVRISYDTPIKLSSLSITISVVPLSWPTLRVGVVTFVNTNTTAVC